jgi:hypothetical protein
MDGDDPQVRQVRWYRRDGDHLVFTPTKAQLDEWDAARERALNVRAALLERHRNELRDFTGASVADWDEYYAERKTQEDEIAKTFDTQRQAAMNQFYRGTTGGWRRSTQRLAISGFPSRKSKNCAHRNRRGSPKRKLHYESSSRRIELPPARVVRCRFRGRPRGEGGESDILFFDDSGCRSSRSMRRCVAAISARVTSVLCFGRTPERADSPG